ncbi:hypothetical protein [Enterobacter ludwigii]|uniref:hypothetical protein n=1 Tax=Enterobacter ludwigii TaxID=299767 RepID=UPI003F6FDA1A
MKIENLPDYLVASGIGTYVVVIKSDIECVVVRTRGEHNTSTATAFIELLKDAGYTVTKN